MNHNLAALACAMGGMSQQAESAAESMEVMAIEMTKVKEYELQVENASDYLYPSVGSPKLLRGGYLGNQRQRRKDRRRIHAAGGKNAFSA